MKTIVSFKPDCEKIIEHLKEELRGIRTGRANASFVENVMVDAYGSQTPLKQMASVSIPDARTIVISPWDASMTKEIEKAITNAQLGVNPSNEGGSVRISLPMLTEENRKGLLKVVGQKVEQAKISLRSQRDDIKDQIQKEEKSKGITEDDKFIYLEQLDVMIKDMTRIAQELGEAKEKEIMTI